jgi:TP901 family phage tail tape measure protein
MSAFVIPTIYAAIDKMTGVQAKIAAGNQALATSSSVAMARMERSMNATSASAMALGKTSGIVALGLLVPLGLATKAAMDFEAQMGNINTLLDKNESLKTYSDGILKIAQEIPKPMADLTEAMYQIRSEGYQGAQALDILRESGKLAVTGLSTTTEAAKSMATAIRVFGKEGLTSNQIADIFFKTVSTGRTKMEAINEAFGENALLVESAGVKFVEFQAATAAMTNAGFSASTAQTSFATAVMSLVKPSETMIELMRKMGYAGNGAAQRLIKDSGGMVAAMEKLDDAAQKTGINIAKAYRNKQGLAAVTALTGQVKEQFLNDMKIMSNGSDMMEEALKKQLGTSSNQAQLMANNIRVLAINVGTLLLPLLNDLVRGVVAIVKPISDWAHAHQTAAKWIFRTVAVVGLLAAAISFVSFVTAMFTKAMWLARAAQIAWNFAQGISIGLQNGMITLLVTNQAGYYGMAAGTWAANAAATVFNTTLKATLGYLTLIVAALYYVNSKMNEWSAKSPLQKEVQFKDNWFNTHSTPIYDSLKKTGLDDAAIRDMANQGWSGNNNFTYTPTGESMDSYKSGGGKADSTPVYLNVNVDKSGNVTVGGKKVNVMNQPNLSPTSE